MRIGELANSTGVSVDTIRFYERRSLVRPRSRSRSGYREFDADSVSRVRFIRRAQDVGFTLTEIAELLALRDRHRSGPDAREYAVAKVVDIDRRMRRLASMRTALEEMIAACACGDGAPECAILETLDDRADVSAPDGAQEPTQTRCRQCAGARKP